MYVWPFCYHQALKGWKFQYFLNIRKKTEVQMDASNPGVKIDSGT